jgi:hypothetical protein
MYIDEIRTLRRPIFDAPSEFMKGIELLAKYPHNNGYANRGNSDCVRRAFTCGCRSQGVSTNRIYVDFLMKSPRIDSGASICVKHWGAQSLPSPSVSPSPPFPPFPSSLLLLPFIPPSPPFPPLPVASPSAGGPRARPPENFFSGTHARTRVLVHF